MNPLAAVFGNGARQSLAQLLNVLLIVSSALAIWKGLSIFTNTESPIVVVLTESMEPAFGRGDLLFLSLDRSRRVAGDIVVYRLPGKEIPIVHRVLNVHTEKKSGKQFLLTKGDNNAIDDRRIFDDQKRGQLWLTTDNIIGVVKGYAPYVGYATILMNDYPWIKYILLSALGFFALITRE